MSKNNNIGRPALSEKRIDTFFRKLEPHLRAGLSLHKACITSGVPKSTVYDLKSSNDDFSEKIQLSQSYQATLVANIVNNELEQIQKDQKETDKNLTRDQLKFVQWVATNSRTTKEEFNRDDDAEVKDEDNTATLNG